MSKEAVAQGGFNSAGRSDNAVAPEETQHGGRSPDGHNEQPVMQERLFRERGQGEIVNGRFQDKGDQELEQIDTDQRSKACRQVPAVTNKIIAQGKQILSCGQSTIKWLIYHALMLLCLQLTMPRS